MATVAENTWDLYRLLDNLCCQPSIRFTVHRSRQTRTLLVAQPRQSPMSDVAGRVQVRVAAGHALKNSPGSCPVPLRVRLFEFGEHLIRPAGHLQHAWLAAVGMQPRAWRRDVGAPKAVSRGSTRRVMVTRWTPAAATLAVPSLGTSHAARNLVQ